MRLFLLRVVPVLCYFLISVTIFLSGSPAWAYGVISAAFVVAYFSAMFLGATIYKEVNECS